LIQSNVKNELRRSLRDNHRAIVSLIRKGDLQNNRFLKVVGENSELKAGIQLLLMPGNSALARATVEDQLRELGESTGLDFMMISTPDGHPLAGVIRSGQLLSAENFSELRMPWSGLAEANGRFLQVASIPIDQGDDNLGELHVGTWFDLKGLSIPGVLIHDKKVVASTIPGTIPAQLSVAFAACAGQVECDVMLGHSVWFSLPVESDLLSNGYVVRILADLDGSARPLLSLLGRVFMTAAGVIFLLAMSGSLMAARFIAKPVSAVVTHLRAAERTGVLPEFSRAPNSIREIQELSESFSRAAASVREAREDLQDAYIEFVGSLAHALDARDTYTAGHSQRVSSFSQAIAIALGLSRADVERIRVGALLHDIGKIGIADAVLQKPGPLTPEEVAIIQLHPGIGRKILEGVHGLAPYLGAVEQHHENWDGSGYPHGLSGEQPAIDARIIHVADAYDAMTSNRPYRRGMTHERALEIILGQAGRQFDPHIALVFAGLPIHKSEEKELVQC
jgi:HD-GYP domain-containing protein (c-di-GMP phosphodiesterase class II)